MVRRAKLSMIDREGQPGRETTDMALFQVRTSQEDISGWSRRRITEALLRETNLDEPVAEQVSMAVEEAVFAANLKFISAPLIRELVDAKLIEMGLEQARVMHTRLGMPVFDVEQLIVNPNRENANVPHGPEATNLTLAENIKKEFALLRVFSEDVGDAHMRGDLHLHGLGFIDRPYCSGQSLEYIKKFGLSLPNAMAIAKPARHPEVLLAHMMKFSAALQSNFAGAIGWDAVNIFFAPYLEGKSDQEVRQLAQMMVYEFSQQAVARGGQAIFSELNLYWEVPKHFAAVPAIGPGGELTGRTYGDYERDAQRFVWALFDVYREGDGAGRPFFSPKPLVHITEKFFAAEGHERFLEHICDVAAEMGNTCFVFDRGETAKISECCRLSFKLDERDLEDAKQPWKMRYSALQNVTLNLPRLGYRAKGDDARLLEMMAEMLELVVKAHLQKRAFIERLLSLGDQGPLGLLTMNRDGSSYLRMSKASYLVGIVGLNELVQIHLGQQMHESKASFKFGLKIISQMKILMEKLSRRHGMHFVLEQTPAESTAYRFARLDLKYYAPHSGAVVKGDISSGEIYYSNSTHVNVGCEMNPLERIELEGHFHPLIEAGALTHIWLGEYRPDSASLANLVESVFRNTLNDQVDFSPEFTFCDACNRTSRGLFAECPYCGSDEVDGITRIAGYFTRISSWNKGKLGELHDRFRSLHGFSLQ